MKMKMKINRVHCFQLLTIELLLQRSETKFKRVSSDKIYISPGDTLDFNINNI